MLDREFTQVNLEQSQAASGTPLTIRFSRFQDVLRRFQGRCVGALVMEADVTLLNSTGGAADLSDPRSIAGILDTAVLSEFPLRRSKMSQTMRGQGLAIASSLAGWNRGDRVPTSTTPVEDDFPSFGSAVADAASVTRRLRWVWPFALPRRGDKAIDGAWAVGESPSELLLTFASASRMTDLFSNGVTVSAVSARLNCMLTRWRAGTAIARLIEWQQATFSEANYTLPKYPYFAVLHNLATAQDVNNQLSVYRSGGSAFPSSEGLEISDLWNVLRGETTLPSLLRQPTGLNTQTLSWLPLVWAPSRADEEDSSIVAWRYSSVPTSYEVMFGRQLPQYDEGNDEEMLELAQAIAVIEARKIPVIAAPQARPAPTAKPWAFPWIGFTANDAAQAVQRTTEAAAAAVAVDAS